MSRSDNMRKTVGRSRAGDKSLNTHYWEVNVDIHTNSGSDLPLVKTAINSVVFLLHPTFRNTKVILRKPPFELKRWGWGEFELGVNVQLEGTEKLLEMVHTLSFAQPETFSIFKVNSAHPSGAEVRCSHKLARIECGRRTC